MEQGISVVVDTIDPAVNDVDYGSCICDGDDITHGININADLNSDIIINTINRVYFQMLARNLVVYLSTQLLPTYSKDHEMASHREIPEAG